MDIPLVDVTLHIDESLGSAQRAKMEDVLRALDGVVSVHNPDARPHLTMVEYNPDRLKSADILKAVTSQGVHAELIGL
jgi:hypothetical protein